ncbi:hypothetical protein D3C80_1763720 [compost metagenome]
MRLPELCSGIAHGFQQPCCVGECQAAVWLPSELLVQFAGFRLLCALFCGCPCGALLLKLPA